MTILVRGSSLRGVDVVATSSTRSRPSPDIHVRTGTTVAEAHGTDHLEGLTLLDVADGREGISRHPVVVRLHRGHAAHRLARRRGRCATTTGSCSPGRTCSSTGAAPRGWTLDRDPYHLETSIPGVFVAGDVRAESVKRVASAVGEGAMAVMLVHRYLERL